MSDSLDTLATIEQITERTTGSLDQLTLKLTLQNIQALAQGALKRAKQAEQSRPCDSEPESVA